MLFFTLLSKNNLYNKKTSRVVGRKISEVKLPPSTTIGALVRNDEVLMLEGDPVIESNDHVIMFLTDKRYIPTVEKLFQVGIHFF